MFGWWLIKIDDGAGQDGAVKAAFVCKADVGIVEASWSS